MASTKEHPVLRFIRRITAPADLADDSDRQLLARFVAGREEGAFAALVRRHGAMVFGVCARVLGGGADAEDAFQATFLVLARKAASVRDPAALGNWLYGVAYCTALKARSDAAGRRARESRVQAVDVSDPADEAAQRDLRQVLDAELNRLPDKYRMAVVLCYLEGWTQEEAARRLGCPRKTVTTRLARACERLRGRLTRRGLALSGGAVAVLLGREAATAAPVALTEVTIKAATQFAAGEAAVAGAVSARVLALTKEVIKAMFVAKLKTAALVLLAVVGIGAAAVALTRPAPAEEPPQEKKQVALPAPAAQADATKEERESLQGAWEGQSAEQDGNALPEEEVKKMRISIKGDRMLLIPGGEWTPVTIKLEPAKSPKVLYMTATEGPDKNKTVPVIYRLDKEADTLTLCWDAKEGKKVPEDFASKKGSGLMLVVVKHEVRPPAAVKD